MEGLLMSLSTREQQALDSNKRHICPPYLPAISD
jgi:hypothetical protein